MIVRDHFHPRIIGEPNKRARCYNTALSTLQTCCANYDLG